MTTPQVHTIVDLVTPFVRLQILRVLKRVPMKLLTIKGAVDVGKTIILILLYRLSIMSGLKRFMASALNAAVTNFSHRLWDSAGEPNNLVIRVYPQQAEMECMTCNNHFIFCRFPYSGCCSCALEFITRSTAAFLMVSLEKMADQPGYFLKGCEPLEAVNGFFYREKLLRKLEISSRLRAPTCKSGHSKYKRKCVRDWIKESVKLNTFDQKLSDQYFIRVAIERAISSQTP